MLLVYQVNLVTLTSDLITDIGIFIISVIGLIIFTALGGFIGSNTRNLKDIIINYRKFRERVKDMTINLPEEETIEEETIKMKKP